jgi:hypothetical protein
MLQNHGEPAWQGKTYNALKDKKHLTGINKEVIRAMELNISPPDSQISCQRRNPPYQGIHCRYANDICKVVGKQSWEGDMASD